MGRRLWSGLLTVALLLLATSSGAVPASAWATIPNPSSGPAQSIGGAAGGCLAGAVALADSGPGFLNAKRSRHRYFGHPDLVRFIDELSTDVGQQTGKRLVIGDMSQPRGGPMPSGHRSHQTGLDADIWFWLAPRTANAQRDLDDDPPSMVESDDRTLNAALWGPDQVLALRRAAAHPLVDRIFVNPAIKAALCGEAGRDRQWLAKLRPWWHHRAHFHVRLRCPPGNTDCAPQPAIPAGDGCGEELAWWFTEEAKAPAPPATPPEEKPLPKACTALLQVKAKR